MNSAIRERADWAISHPVFAKRAQSTLLRVPVARFAEPVRTICPSCSLTGPGTYVIHTPDGVYVGRSKDVTGRWAQHRTDLRKGRHHSTRLQAAHDEHGMASFWIERVSHDPADEARIGMAYGTRLLNTQSLDPTVMRAQMRAVFLSAISADELHAELRRRGENP